MQHIFHRKANNNSDIPVSGNKKQSFNLTNGGSKMLQNENNCLSPMFQVNLLNCIFLSN